MDDHTYYPPDVLASQDGKEVPLTVGFGGPVVGTAKMKFDPETGHLNADIQVTDPQMAELLESDPSFIPKKKES